MLDIEAIREKFGYCPATGQIAYKVKTRYHNPGDIAGKVCKATGYVRIASKCGAANSMHAHRLAWALHYGEFPETGIDHINGVKTDNRICNLRKATPAENSQNVRQRKRQKYPWLPMGVCFHKGTGKFQAKIKLNYKTISLGYFSCVPDAEAAYLAAKKRVHPFFDGV